MDRCVIESMRNMTEFLLLLLVTDSHYIKALSSNKKMKHEKGDLQYLLPAGDDPFDGTVCPACRFIGLRGTGLKNVAN